MTIFQSGIPEFPFRTPVEILDCTLRDGSYSVDFQFSEEVITNVLSGPEKSGVRYAEPGHGLGLNAGTALSRPAPAVADLNRVDPTEELVMRTASNLAATCAA